MDGDDYEIRIEYEEEVEVRTEMRIETRDPTGCPLHGGRQRCGPRMARRARGARVTPRGRPQGEASQPQPEGVNPSGK